MRMDKQETVLELRTKILLDVVFGRHPCESHMGLHRYGTCELPANNTTPGKAPRTWQLALELETAQIYLNAT